MHERDEINVQWKTQAEEIITLKNKGIMVSWNLYQGWNMQCFWYGLKIDTAHVCKTFSTITSMIISWGQECLAENAAWNKVIQKASMRMKSTSRQVRANRYSMFRHFITMICGWSINTFTGNCMLLNCARALIEINDESKKTT